MPHNTIYECILPGMGENGGDYHYQAKLGSWLNSQRCAKKGTNGSCRLTEERDKQLESLSLTGMLLWDASEQRASVLRSDKSDISWPRNYAALIHYGEVHGTCNIPQRESYECILPGMGENGSDFHFKANLGAWLNNQRKKRKALGNNKLNPNREALMQSLVDQGIECIYYVFIFT
jgi:hypothetical protein